MMEETHGSYTNKSFEADEPKADNGHSKFNYSTRSARYQKAKQKYNDFEEWRILINVVVISLSFTLLFTSFMSMSNLQSSINPGVGPIALAVLYAALVLSCAFVPTWLIKKLKVKWTLALCMLGYSCYIAAQFYPSVGTLVPTAIVLGLGAAPMWSAKCTYLTQVSRVYADLVGEDVEVIITRFFGIFFLFFQSAQIWGNLISSTVLSSDTAILPNKTDEQLELCGVNFCPANAASAEGNNITLIEPPDMSQIRIMSSIYLGCALLSSVIIALFVDPLTRYEEDEKSAMDSEESGFSLLIATFSHMKKPYQLLIIPLTIWSGVEQGFFQSDFTAAFVSCGIGVHMVGYVLICYGICDSICSVTFSPMVKIVGRVPIFILGSLLNIGVIILKFTWMPHPDDTYLFFVVAALWGVSDAVWQTQINALYGVIFPTTASAAFSNYRLWESMGFILAFILHTKTCVDIKLYVYLSILIVGMFGYFIIEGLEMRRMKSIKKNSLH